MTERLSADDPRDLRRAAALLKAGEVVAFPTETVYGLGADGLDEAAVAKIFAAKGRPGDNPLILHVASFDAAEALWDCTTAQRALACTLAEALWPGPLTLVLPAAPAVQRSVMAGLPTVAVRWPAHPVAERLIRAVGRPLAAPSANRSGRPSPTTAEHVQATLGGRIAAVLDGGPTTVGVESTVLDLSRVRPQILRPGDVDEAQLRALLPDLDRGPVPADAASPGLRHRHYAPAGLTVALVDEQVLTEAWGGRAAVLCRRSTADRHGGRGAPLEVLPDDPRGFAAGLYAALYRLERSGADALLIEAVPADEAWHAVADRLRRAAD